MKLFKAISNLFKKKEKPLELIPDAAQPGPLLTEEKKPLVIDRRDETVAPIEVEPKVVPPKKLGAKQPKKETILGDAKYRKFASPFQKVYEPKEFDTTPNPNKFWRRFKRNGKIYYKKFYKEVAA